MKIGKLPNDILEKLVFSNIKHKRKEVIVRAGVGEDNAILDFGKYGCIVSTDPITGASKDIGSLAVHISCNDVASSGGEPIGILMTIMAPESTTKEEIETIMKDAGQTAQELNVEIIGGHTEITDAVNKVVISTTVIGRQLKEKLAYNRTVNTGDKIVMTKSAGIEGTAIIAKELEEELKGSISDELIRQGKSLSDSISVLKEGKLCSDIGVLYMHDITEGGVLGAVWEVSKAINKGIKIYENSIPIQQSTLEICKYYGIDPLKLISSGSMIIIIGKDKINLIKDKFNQEKIPFSIIGEVIDEGVLLEKDKEVVDILPPDSDELYKVV